MLPFSWKNSATSVVDLGSVTLAPRLLPLLVPLYFLYVIYDRTIIDDNLLNYSIIDQHENNLNESRNNIDTLIVGGSNAFYGLSAEQMTKEIDMNVYNLSLAYEGYSLNNYVYYLIPNLVIF